MIESRKLTAQEQENLAKLDGGAGGKKRGDVPTENIKLAYKLGLLPIADAFQGVVNVFKNGRRKKIPRSAQLPPKADGE